MPKETTEVARADERCSTFFSSQGFVLGDMSGRMSHFPQVIRLQRVFDSPGED